MQVQVCVQVQVRVVVAPVTKPTAQQPVRAALGACGTRSIAPGGGCKAAPRRIHPTLGSLAELPELQTEPNNGSVPLHLPSTTIPSNPVAPASQLGQPYGSGPRAEGGVEERQRANVR